MAGKKDLDAKEIARKDKAEYAEPQREGMKGPKPGKNLAYEDKLGSDENNSLTT